MKRFIFGRLKSIRYAINGFLLLLKTEDAVIVHCFTFLIFLGLGFFFAIEVWQWALQMVVFGVLFVTEAVNTAIEKLCDFVHPDFHKKIGEVKDISAGAVTFASLFGVIVLAIIYTPYLWNFLF